jgi:dimethylamine/trimethylamine dehydrogenase
MYPIRCTQNPTMGEEWRRGWHPERISAKRDEAHILVVGGGPAGLECARGLGQRGYTVSLVEARRELGGRVALEANLPGLSEWRRVVDWRLTQIRKLPSVTIYPGSPMTAEEVLEAGIEHVILATGSHWRRDGIGRQHWQAIPGYELPNVYTPDDLMEGRLPAGLNPDSQVVIYDDDHYYMGGVLAELLAGQGCKVTLVTPEPLVSAWTVYTLEQERIAKRLLRMGVRLIRQHKLAAIFPGAARLESTVSGEPIELACEVVVLVTERLPEDGVYLNLKTAVTDGRLASMRLIGDAEAPGLIAQAVYAGHLAAREFGEPLIEGTPFKVERIRFDRVSD